MSLLATFQTPGRDRLIDSVGRFRTQSLFREMSHQGDDHDPIFTLKENDPQGKLPSLHRLYMEVADPTEYDFAMLAFGSWRHFTHLSKLQWFAEYLDRYREELEIKLRSAAIKDLLLHARTKGGTPAAKFLSEAGWKPKKHGRGRPSKEEVEGERRRLAQIDAEVGADAQRLGLTIIEGGKVASAS